MFYHEVLITIFDKEYFHKNINFMLIVGIAGGTGSGKTTVVNKVIDEFHKDQVIVLPQDAYYKDNSQISLEERQKINFDHPDSVEPS